MFISGDKRQVAILNAYREGLVGAKPKLKIYAKPLLPMKLKLYEWRKIFRN